MSDLEESRRRIAEAADLECVRIERDLHDGAQQRLVVLRIRLSLIEDRLKTDPAAGPGELHDLGFEIERTREELRSLAHGVYPSLLTDLGIPAALEAVARRAPMPVRVTAVGVTRHATQLETAIYFTCVEAIQNSIKHAQSASGAWVTLTETPRLLRFEVRDDGRAEIGDAA